MLDNCFDMRQGEAETTQDCINCEDIRALPLQNSTKTALDEKMRGYWLFRTSALSEQEIAGIRIVTEGSTGLVRRERSIRQSFRDGERKLAMTVGNRKTESVMRQAVLVITFTQSLTVRSLSQRQIWKASANGTCGTRPMTKLSMKQ